MMPFEGCHAMSGPLNLSHGFGFSQLSAGNLLFMLREMLCVQVTTHIGFYRLLQKKELLGHVCARVAESMRASAAQSTTLCVGLIYVRVFGPHA